jgi:hypothetical protein
MMSNKSKLFSDSSLHHWEATPERKQTYGVLDIQVTRLGKV